MWLRVLFILLIIVEVPFLVKAKKTTSINFSLYDLKIYGKSNINNFAFTLNTDSNTFQDNIIIEKNILRTDFLIPVIRFKTHNKNIQNDFFKMLKAEAFPYIKLSINNDQLEQIASGNNCESLSTIITIANESKQFCIPVTKGEKQRQNQYIIGNIEILLSDFNLEPISKFLGLVKVENEVEIEFKINFITSQLIN